LISLNGETGHHYSQIKLVQKRKYLPRLLFSTNLAQFSMNSTPFNRIQIANSVIKRFGPQLINSARFSTQSGPLHSTHGTKSRQLKLNFAKPINGMQRTHHWPSSSSTSDGSSFNEAEATAQQ
jgi:hypothetical protein